MENFSDGLAVKFPGFLPSEVAALRLRFIAPAATTSSTG